MNSPSPSSLPLARLGGSAAAGSLPLPDAESCALSAALVARIAARIERAGGWLPFDHYMQLALYEPGLGYYDGARTKFGAAGDFVTAPEMSPLFARCIAAQLAQLFEELPPRVLEFGAGSGALAAELIAELARLGHPVERYAIVELSTELRARQRLRLSHPAAATAVQWLDAPPSGFAGVILANEVLDVMPVRLFVKRDGQFLERGVALGDTGLHFDERPAPPELAAEAAAIESQTGPLPDVYGSELGLIGRAWAASLAGWLSDGVALLIDYGFPMREYYHPQRLMGTVMCHYRHHAHADPLWLPGLNDITAHVDFTAVAEAAFDAGLRVLGYTSQARFLLNCGLLELLEADNSPRQAAQAQRLVSEAEMGELIKVIALGRGVRMPLKGFALGDRTHRL